jgi:hypothetical protein
MIVKYGNNHKATGCRDAAVEAIHSTRPDHHDRHCPHQSEHRPCHRLAMAAHPLRPTLKFPALPYRNTLLHALHLHLDCRNIFRSGLHVYLLFLHHDDDS